MYCYRDKSNIEKLSQKTQGNFILVSKDCIKLVVKYGSELWCLLVKNMTDDWQVQMDSNM